MHMPQRTACPHSKGDARAQRHQTTCLGEWTKRQDRQNEAAGGTEESWAHGLTTEVPLRRWCLFLAEALEPMAFEPEALEPVATCPARRAMRLAVRQPPEHRQRRVRCGRHHCFPH